MSRLKDKVEKNFDDHVFTDLDLGSLLGSTAAARYGMVNKALKKGEIVRIRRGLYLLADKYRQKKLSKFFLANRIVPHSYISLESALNYYGWIPEHVAMVTSICYKGRTKKFNTPFGEFAYYQLPVKEYEFLTGVTRIEEIKEEPFLLASPLRALADYVYINKLDDADMNYFINSLRIEKDQLMQIQRKSFLEVKRVYRTGRVIKFLNKLQQELKK